MVTLSPTPNRERLLRLFEVLDVVPVSRATLARWEREDYFPRRRYLNGTTIVWLESEVLAFVSQLPPGRGPVVVRRPPRAAHHQAQATK